MINRHMATWVLELGEKARPAVAGWSHDDISWILCIPSPAGVPRWVSIQLYFSNGKGYGYLGADSFRCVIPRLCWFSRISCPRTRGAWKLYPIFYDSITAFLKSYVRVQAEDVCVLRLGQTPYRKLRSDSP